MTYSEYRTELEKLGGAWHGMTRDVQKAFPLLQQKIYNAHYGRITAPDVWSAILEVARRRAELVQILRKVNREFDLFKVLKEVERCG